MPGILVDHLSSKLKKPYALVGDWQLIYFCHVFRGRVNLYAKLGVYYTYSISKNQY